MKHLKKIILILIILFLNTNFSKGQQIDGFKVDDYKGVLSLSDSYSKEDTLRFYNEDGSEWYKLSYYYERGENFMFFNKDFKPFSFHPDYFVFTVCIKEEFHDSYKVVVNHEKEVFKTIKKSEFIKFFTWEEYLLNKVFSVDITVHENQIFTKPKEKSGLMDVPRSGPFTPKKVMGSWLKIEWKENEIVKCGWVLWRKKGYLNVALLELS